MSTVPRTHRRRSLVLHAIDWQTYTRLLRAFASQPRVRLTYDRGALEIMSPLYEHAGDAYLLGRFVDTLTDELDWPVFAGRSTTLRRRRQRRGLEPDNCYWIASAPLMQGKEHLDLRTDPPPDLAIAVDITHSSLDRMGIYAALKVPEVWREDEQGLSFHVLGPDGQYTPATHSLSFPLVTPTDLIGFLRQRGQIDDTALVRQFRAWVRQQIAAHGIKPSQP